jgi:hypothetical protein
MSDFPNTRWTAVVHRAARHDAEGLDEAATAALSALCEAYWYPIYAYAHAWGKSHHEAEDLTQIFLHQLIANRWLARADRYKTKFRTFSLTYFKYVLSNQEFAGRHGLAVDVIKQRVSRLNRRFREVLVGVVADTVSDPAQVDEEIESLVMALAG